MDICPGIICPGDICPYQEYLSCYWPDFDETLKVASWEHLEQILTIKLTFFQAAFVLGMFVHIRNISADTDSFYQTLKIDSKKIFDFNYLEPFLPNHPAPQGSPVLMNPAQRED